MEYYRNPKVLQRYFLAYCLGCILGLGGNWFTRTTPGFPLGGPGDFTTFYTGAQIVRSGQAQNLYELQTQMQVQRRLLSSHGWVFKDGLLPYVYPPVFAIIFIPLTLLPLNIAFHAWNMISMALLLVSIRLLLKKYNCYSPLRFSQSLIIILAFFPIYEVFFKGQATFLMLFILTIVFIQLGRGNEGTAGLGLGCALIKPQLVIGLVVWFLVQKCWRMLGAFVISAFFMITVSLSIVGVEGAKQYFSLASMAMRWDGHYNFLPAIMPNIRGTVYRFAHLYEWIRRDSIDMDTLAFLSGIFTCFALGALCLLYFKNRELGLNMDLQFAAALIAAILVSPYLYNHDLGILVLVGFILYGVSIKRKRDLNGKAFIAAGHLALLAPMLFTPNDLCAQAIMLVLCGAGWYLLRESHFHYEYE